MDVAAPNPASFSIIKQEERIIEDQEDPFTQLIGEYGPWQFKWHFIMALSVFLHSWQMMSNKFLTHKTDFWCTPPPELEWTGSQSSLVQHWMNVSAPQLPDGTMDQCHLFDVDYSNWDQQRPNESTPVRKCTHWDHDTSMFQNTIIQRWDLVCDQKHMPRVAQMTFFAGNFVGVSLSGPFSDYWGRKTAYMSLLTGMMIFGALAPLVPSLTIWIGMRFIVGGCSLGFFNCLAVYNVEITGGKWRSVSIHAFGEVQFHIGIILLGLWVYFFRDMYTLELAMSLTVLPWLSLWWFLPESPRWLLARGQFDRAKTVIKVACDSNGRSPNEAVIDEFIESRRVLLNQGETSSQKATFLDLFRHRHIRRNTLLIGFCWISFTMGYFGLFYNTPTLSLNMFVVFVLPAAAMLPTVFVQPWMENKLGRKAVLSGSLTIAGCVLMIIVALPRGSMGIVVCAWIGTVACSFAFSVGYSYTRELFPTVLRSTALCFCSAMARFGAVSSPIIAMLDVFGPKVPLMVYGGIALLAGIISIWIWPETSQTRLPDSIEECELIASSPNTWLQNPFGSSNRSSKGSATSFPTNARLH